MPRWLISVPAWGERYVALARSIALPSMVAAARHATHEATFVVHTDRPDEFADCFGGFPHELREVPSGCPESYLVPFHRDVVDMATPGDFVSPLNADCIVSREAFRASEEHFAKGKRIVVFATVRTDGASPPGPDSDAETIIDFMMSHPHQWVTRATWETFSTFQPAVIYQRSGENFVCNTFAMHPMGFVVPEGGLPYKGAVDDDLHKCFDSSDYHIVTGQEMAVIELTPPDSASCWDVYAPPGPGLYTTKPVQWITDWAMAARFPIQRWFFRHRVVYRGDPDFCFTDDPVPAILAGIDRAECDPDVTARHRTFSGDGHEHVNFFVNHSVPPAPWEDTWRLMDDREK